MIYPKLILVGTLLGVPITTNAWSFYWSKVEVQTSSWRNCMNIAYGAANDQHLAQLKRTNLDVTGNLNGAFATVTCIGTGSNSKAMAVVMVVGDAGGPVKQLRDRLVADVTARRILDNNP